MENEIETYHDIIKKSEKLKGYEEIIKEFIETAIKYDIIIIKRIELDILYNRINELIEELSLYKNNNLK